MSLRLRLIIAFFLLSVVPLGAVTYYSYRTNAQALREAAGREAELLAGDLTDRMELVTLQLGHQFQQIMALPVAQTDATLALASGGAVPNPGDAQRLPAQPDGAVAPSTPAPPEKSEEEQVAELLGEMAMLLNNIEVRSPRRGRGGPGRGRNGGPGGGPGGAAPDGQADRGGPGSLGPDSLAGPGGRAGEASFPGRFGRPGGAEPGPSNGARGTPEGPRGGGGRGGGDGARGGNGDDAADPSQIRIDLGPVRREILRQIAPDRERFDQLSPDERARVLAAVNERMLGIEQGIEMLQREASERAATARAQAEEAARTAPPPAAPKPPAPPARPDAPAPAPGATAPTAPAADVARVQRLTELSGNRLDVRLEQNGELLGQVNAEINVPNLLAAVFTAARRERGEVPFAVDPSGRVYTPTIEDRERVEGLGPSATEPGVPPHTTVVGNWVVVTTAGPTGSEITFGIARPLGEALGDLRRTAARNAGLGLGLIGLALIGIVPLSGRLTRNLDRLSEGVSRISQGDYRARVDVRSSDEIGALAAAFNRMAEDVERHQQAVVVQERLRRELELGRQIQRDMLPPPLRLGLTEMRGVSVPAREVGGDFFNYFETEAGTIALIVGDVSGKGVGAALLMANIQASLRTRLALGQDLAAIADALDRELDRDLEATAPGPVYTTLFVGVLDPVTRVLEYVNAGHNPQYVVRRSNGLESMPSTGLPIGLLAGRGYDAHRVQLSPGDILFFYTDGCVEAENAAGEMFGVERLESLLLSAAASNSADVLTAAEAGISRFRAGRELFDDATMMVVNVG